MSIKNFDENLDKWILHSTNLAKHITVLDLSGYFEGNNVEDVLKEINEDLKNRYTKDEVDNKLDSVGGFYLVDTLTERDNIPLNKREEGVLCWVRSERMIYQLVGGINNSNWTEFKTSSSNVQLNYDDISYMGTEEPENEDVIWFDDSTDGISEFTETNPIIEELKNIIQSMSKKISKLEQQVEYLMLNGGGSGGNPGGDDDDKEETVGNYIILEDGSKLLLESGEGILLEEPKTPTPSSGDYIILEDGSKLLLENGEGMLLEQSKNPIPSSTNNLLIEDGSKLLLENGSKILLEK